MITVKRKIFFHLGNSGRREISDRQMHAPAAVNGRIPRISKLMALAIRFEGLLATGEVSDQSELARLAKVTQPRMTQIMNLLHLAPDIQEELLHLPPAVHGKDHFHERMLRPVAALNSWGDQRHLWLRLRALADANIVRD
jgi:hypothetical protein